MFVWIFCFTAWFFYLLGFFFFTVFFLRGKDGWRHGWASATTTGSKDTTVDGLALVVASVSTSVGVFRTLAEKFFSFNFFFSFIFFFSFFWYNLVVIGFFHRDLSSFISPQLDGFIFQLEIFIYSVGGQSIVFSPVHTICGFFRIGLFGRVGTTLVFPEARSCCGPAGAESCGWVDMRGECVWLAASTCTERTRYFGVSAFAWAEQGDSDGSCVCSASECAEGWSWWRDLF